MFEGIFDNIKKKLDVDDKIRETTLKISRKSIRNCQEAVRAIHRGDFESARQKLKESQELIQEVERNIKKVSPRLYYKGYVVDMQQEFVEASLFLTLIEKGTEIESPEVLNVSNFAYLHGVGDVIGELRRHALDAVRSGETQEAERALGLMEELYDLLRSLEYPDGLIPGIRRKVDISRSLIEKTRNDLAYFEHGNKLVTGMDQLLKKLKNQDTDSE